MSENKVKDMSVLLHAKTRGGAECQMIMYWKDVIQKFKDVLSLEVARAISNGYMYHLNMPKQYLFEHVSFYPLNYEEV